MTLARTMAVALCGLDGRVTDVECDIGAGLPGLSFTGLADTSVSESRDRLRAAIVNSGAQWPNRKITVALLPADVRKSGSGFDLAIGMCILAAAQVVPASAVADCVWIAELSLGGKLRPVRGVLPAVLTARAAGVRRVVVARANVGEASLVTDIDVRSADRLDEVIAWLTGSGPALSGTPEADLPPVEPETAPCLAEVAGQGAAKTALTLAAAGGHHLSMVGSPGAGKTMLAQRLPGLLPPLTDEQALEVTAVQSIAGILPGPRLVRRPPWQAPHHTSSTAALIGGGSKLARPGAISLAHHGVLFLDEAPEFGARALDALRQPLEDEYVSLHRSGGTVRYPCRFQTVLAANPCPCAQSEQHCECPSQAKRRYRLRMSGPLLDRIDLHLRVQPVARAELFDPVRSRETSQTVAARVATARDAAAERWAGTGWAVNARAPGSRLRDRPWALPRHALRGLQHQFDNGALSARGFDRVLRVSWTVADLGGRTMPNEDDVNEALYYRMGQGSPWAA